VSRQARGRPGRWLDGSTAAPVRPFRRRYRQRRHRCDPRPCTIMAIDRGNVPRAGSRPRAPGSWIARRPSHDQSRLAPGSRPRHPHRNGRSTRGTSDGIAASNRRCPDRPLWYVLLSAANTKRMRAPGSRAKSDRRLPEERRGRRGTSLPDRPARSDSTRTARSLVAALDVTTRLGRGRRSSRCRDALGRAQAQQRQ